MTRINRQRYMAELSRLLAFMFKEDKEDILAKYNKMLDEAEDEQALLEEFGSPTKLAVTISRTYKREERKLSVEADSKEDAQSAPLEFGTKAAEEPAAKEPEPDVPSYADIIEEIRREKAAEQGIEYKPIFFNEPETPAVEESPVVEEAPVEEESPVVEEVPVVEETPVEEEAPAVEEAPVEEEVSVEEEAPAVEEGPVEEEAPAVEEVPAIEEAPVEEEAPAVEEIPVAEEAPVEEDAPVEEEACADESTDILDELESAEPPAPKTLYKTNAALLVLYLIFAVPIGLLLLVLAAAVGLTLLGTVIGIGAIAVKVVGFAVSTLAVFADVMLCIGAALIAAAVGLALLWLALLLLIKGIPGICRGAVALGRKFCVKEVGVND